MTADDFLAISSAAAMRRLMSCWICRPLLPFASIRSVARNRSRARMRTACCDRWISVLPGRLELASAAILGSARTSRGVAAKRAANFGRMGEELRRGLFQSGEPISSVLECAFIYQSAFYAAKEMRVSVKRPAHDRGRRHGV